MENTNDSRNDMLFKYLILQINVNQVVEVFNSNINYVFIQYGKEQLE